MTRQRKGVWASRGGKLWESDQEIYGMIRVILIMFICAGSFRLNSPSQVIRMFFSSWYQEGTFLQGNLCPAFRQKGLLECEQRRGNSADLGETSMKKDSEASAVLQGRWRENEEGRKHALRHRLGDTGPPGQAPESLEDLAWREGGPLGISSCNPGGDNDSLGRGSGCVWWGRGGTEK